MRDRFASDVLALAPDVVHIMGGVNDIGTDDREPADIIADLDAMATAALSAGVTVIMGTTTPSDFMNTAGKIATLNTVNDWIRARAGVQVADYAAALSVGGLGEELDDAYHSDGVHWNSDAEGRAAAAAVLQPILDTL